MTNTKNVFIAERQKNNYDFLRLFAALCVTFAHSFNYCYPNYIEPLYAITNGKTNSSHLGLCTFFSLSGYLIAKSARNSTSIWHFLWKRLLRIQPLLIVVCIVTVFLIGPLFTSLTIKNYFFSGDTWTYFRTIFPLTGVQFTLPGVFESYSEASVNGSLWTLVVEERLYLLVALVLFLPKINKIIWYTITAAVNIYFIIQLLQPELIPFQYNHFTVFLALLFINAVCIHELQLDFDSKHYLFLSVILFFCLFSLLNSKFAFLQVLFLPMLVNIIAHIKCGLSQVGKYGDFSYAIYVFSFPVQQMLCSVKTFRENPYLQFICTLAIVIPLVVISWHFIEKKMLLFKNRFAAL